MCVHEVVVWNSLLLSGLEPSLTTLEISGTCIFTLCNFAPFEVYLSYYQAQLALQVKGTGCRHHCMPLSLESFFFHAMESCRNIQLCLVMFVSKQALLTAIYSWIVFCFVCFFCLPCKLAWIKAPVRLIHVYVKGNRIEKGCGCEVPDLLAFSLSASSERRAGSCSFRHDCSKIPLCFQKLLLAT